MSQGPLSPPSAPGPVRGLLEQLKPYPAYKDSSIRWLGEVPAHWEVRRIKTLFREKEERSDDGVGTLLSLTRARGLVPHSEATKRPASASDLSNYKVCRAGDLVMNRMQAWSGMFAVASSKGLISPDYSVFRATAACEVRYFQHLFKTTLLVDQFAQASKGIGSGFNRLYTPDFGAIHIGCPPLPEQAAIVRFLDFMDRRIRRVIRARERRIELLEEYRQALIHQAVTGQIDVRTGRPYPAYKDSGVEWLGGVPAHWEVLPLCVIARPKKITGCGSLELLSVYLRRGVVRFSDVPEKRTNPTSEDLESYQRVDPGDLVLNNQQAWRGSAGVSAYTGIVSPAYLVFRFIQPIDRTFADRLFQDRSMVSQYLIASKGVGSIQRNLYWPHLRRAIVSLPPLPEQTAIVRFLDEQTEKIDRAITSSHRSIDLLHELRTRLISDVVTGKLDVRETAARLPEEDEALELPGVPEAGVGGEAVREEGYGDGEG